MATVLPSTGADDSVTPVASCNTDDMFLVHGLLRSLYLGAACLVRSVGDDQPRRRRAVSAHIAMIADMLHHHHHTEDTLLWDELEQRAPACALHVGLMRRQHADMADLIVELRAALQAWDARGIADDGTLSTLLEKIRATLEQHLGQEEDRILPFADRVFTQAEWDRLGEMGSSHTPKNRLFVQLGYLLQSLPDADRHAWVRANLPAPVRVLWQLVGSRQFLRYRRTLAVNA